MQEINTENILEEVRKEIMEKDMKPSGIKFSDIPVESEFKTSLMTLNILCHEKVKYPCGKGLKGLAKKIILKLVRPVVREHFDAQYKFNEHAVMVMNQLDERLKMIESKLNIEN